MSHMKRIPRKQMQNFVYIDHRNEVAIVGTVPEAHGEDIIAIGRYYLDQKTNRAEVAFVVRDDWQKRGHRHLHPEAPGHHRQAERHRRLHGRGPARQQAHAGGHQPQRRSRCAAT